MGERKKLPDKFKKLMNEDEIKRYYKRLEKDSKVEEITVDTLELFKSYDMTIEELELVINRLSIYHQSSIKEIKQSTKITFLVNL